MNKLYIMLRQRLRNAFSAFGILDNTLVGNFKRIEQRLKFSRFLAVPESGVIHYNGFKLGYRKQDKDLVDVILRMGVYEIETSRVVKSYLRRGMTFVDAGAHIGYYSMMAAKLVGPEGHVYSFEPAPGTFAQLKDNVRLNGFSSWTTVEPLAITEHKTILEFIIDDQSSVSSRIVDSSETGVPIEAISLDEYFGSHTWPPVHLVKMDIEGAELAGLRGMRELVARNTTIAVIFEIHFKNLNRQGVSISELFDELLSMGFTRFSILRDQTREIRVPEDIDFIAEFAAGTIFNVLAQKLS